MKVDFYLIKIKERKNMASVRKKDIDTETDYSWTVNW